MMVINYDDFKRDSDEVNKRICDFLDIAYVPKNATAVNPTKPSRYTKEDFLPPSTREYLEKFYRPYNDQLAELLGPEWEGVWK